LKNILRREKNISPWSLYARYPDEKLAEQIQDINVQMTHPSPSLPEVVHHLTDQPAALSSAGRSPPCTQTAGCHWTVSVPTTEAQPCQRA
jgi:hypothetical protein